MWREPPDYLALKPSYYTIIVQYTTINLRPGNNHLPHNSILARGNTHFPRSSAHLRSRPGEAPTFRVLPSRPKSTPPSATGFREPPKAGVALGKFPTRQTVSSLWSYGVSVPRYPARAGVPLLIWGFASTIRTLPNMGCGLPEQAHKSLNLQLRSLALFSRTGDQCRHI